MEPLSGLKACVYDIYATACVLDRHDNCFDDILPSLPLVRIKYKMIIRWLWLCIINPLSNKSSMEHIPRAVAVAQCAN